MINKGGKVYSPEKRFTTQCSIGLYCHAMHWKNKNFDKNLDEKSRFNGIFGGYDRCTRN